MRKLRLGMFSKTQNATQLGEEPGFKPKAARLMSNHSCTDPSIHVVYILYLYYSAERTVDDRKE